MFPGVPQPQYMALSDHLQILMFKGFTEDISPLMAYCIGSTQSVWQLSLKFSREKQSTYCKIVSVQILVFATDAVYWSS